MHLHTVSSDGHLTLDELVQKYSKEKFDFISITDHWCLAQLNGNR
jgi:predicted metal-dependent phosphoesterase TrpH